MTLDSLQKRFPEWKIKQTPGGVFVAERRKHIVLTLARIDQGVRQTFIESDEDALIELLEKQRQLDI